MPMKPRRRPSPRRQAGVAALLILLVLLSTAAYFLLRSLNAGLRPQAASEATTQQALRQAREALLGYAVRYPDNPEVDDLNAGPGHLPCPDQNKETADPFFGVGDSPCARSSGTETGLLPWHTLDLNELRDGSGAPLWYAVSDNFRNNPKNAVNSTTRGTLHLDNCTANGEDIAAIIIAPGPALTGQDRIADLYSAPKYAALAATYLEGQNATIGDNCFSSQRDSTHNDQVLVITRRELMAVVEHRVMEDVANALRRYRKDPDGDDVSGIDPDCPSGTPTCDDGYPWLAPFSNPRLDKYIGVVGTASDPLQHGLLPLRRQDVNFKASFTVSWEILAGGTLTTLGGTNHPPEACVRNTADTSCNFPGTASPPPVSGDISGALSTTPGWSQGVCHAAFNAQLKQPLLICTAQRTFTDAGSQFERNYEFTLTNMAYQIKPPTATTPRYQAYELTNASLAADPNGSSLKIEITDCQLSTSIACNEKSSTFLGQTTLNLPAGAAVTRFHLIDIPFDLEVSADSTIDPATRRSPGELPQWFVANDWHKQFYVAYAAAQAPGAGAIDCAPPNCLRVNWTRPAPLPLAQLPNVNAVILNAGDALTGQDRSLPIAPIPMTVYFEGSNATGSVSFEKRSKDATFNDDLRMLAPNE